MFNLIRADLYTLRKSAAVKILFIIVSITALAMVMVSYLIAEGTLDTSILSNASGLCDPMMVSLASAIIAGVFICGDFENKTLHAAISSGYGRGTVIISKAVSFFIAVAIMVLPYCIITAIAFGTGSEFTPYLATTFFDILDRASSATYSAETFFKILVISLTTMLVYASQLSICVLVAFWLRRPIIVAGVGFGLPLLINLFMSLGNDVELIEKLFSITPYTMNYPAISMEASAGDFLKAIIVSVGFIVVVLAITYGGFRKSEIK